MTLESLLGHLPLTHESTRRLSRDPRVGCPSRLVWVPLQSYRLTSKGFDCHVVSSSVLVVGPGRDPYFYGMGPCLTVRSVRM